MYSTSILSTLANKLQTLMGKRKLILTLGVIAVGMQRAMASDDATGADKAKNLADQNTADNAGDAASVVQTPEQPQPNEAQLMILKRIRNLLDKRQELLSKKDDAGVAEVNRHIKAAEAEYEKAGKPGWYRHPFARTAAGILGIAGLPSTYFIAGSVKTDAKWEGTDIAIENGNQATTQNIGFSAADVHGMNEIENAEHLGKADIALTHDLHDVMFAEDLNMLREVGIRNVEGEFVEGQHFTAEGKFNADALFESITVYLIVGILCALVAIGFLYWAAGFGRNRGVVYSSGAAVIGVIAGGSMAIGGYHKWLNEYAADMNADEMAFSDQWMIIVGIGLAAAGMIVFLGYLSYQFLKAAICPNKAKGGL